MDTSTPPPAPDHGAAPPRPTGVDGFFDSIRRVGISRGDDRWIGGVASGVATRLGIDPLVVRGIVAVTVLLGGIGLVLYGIAWALLPERRDGRIHFQQLVRGDFDVAVLGAFLLVALGLGVPDRWYPGLWWAGPRGSGWTALLWFLAVAVVVVLVVATLKDRPTGTGPTTTLPPTATPPTATPPTSTPPTAMPPTAMPPTGPAPTFTDRGPAMTTPTSPSPAAPPTAHLAAPAPRGGTGPTTSLPPQPPAGGPPARPVPPTGGTGPTGPTGPVGPTTTLPRPGPRGPGAGVVGGVFAVSLIVLAGLMYAERVGQFSGPVLLTAGGVAVVLMGLAIIVSGLRGRTGGPLGGVAVLAVLVLLPVAAVERSSWTWDSASTAVGDISHTPRTVDEAQAGYSLGAGEARIDLTALPPGRATIDVPVNVGAGEVLVILPEGGDYAADVTVFAGEVVWLGDAVTRVGGGGAVTYESDSVAEGADPRIRLDVTVGAGTVRVEEAP